MMTVLARLVLVALYSWAVISKVRHMATFEDYLRPTLGHSSGLLARATLVAEGLIIAAIVTSFGLPPLVTGAAIASALFLILVSAVYAGLLMQGASAGCQCFGRHPVKSDVRVEWRPALLALRNWALIALSLSLVLDVSARTAYLGGITAVALVAVGLVGGCVRERRRLRLTVHPLTSAYATEMKYLQAHSWWVNGRPRPF